MRSLPESLTDSITGHIFIPPTQASYAPWDASISTNVRQALERRYISQLWSHQAQAFTELTRGSHIVVATGTGSGKSLTAWIPVLNALDSFSHTAPLASRNRRPTTLYLAPTKALAADQFTNLESLVHDVNPQLIAAIADGDTDTPGQRYARDYADIILSNPDFLHFSMLAKHEHWARLWRGLKFIIIDEFHHYRGNFGAHVALILRRTLRIAHHYGAHPQVIFLSATVSNPAQAAQRFLGEAFGPVQAINEDGSPHGALDLYTISGGDSANKQAADITSTLVAENKRLLTFVRSRPGTERVAELTRENLVDTAPHLATRIAAYRGGYLPEERRELEHDLRSGKIRALATTSALELGIDIAGLDAVVVIGWPGTPASFQQQIGRTGRAGATGLAFFIARNNPLDQYLINHLDMLISPGNQSPTFDPTNPWILPDHLAAAAHEFPLTTADLPIFSLPNTNLFTEMVAADLLRKRPTGWFWNTATRIHPHNVLELREGGQSVPIVHCADGAVLGTVDRSRADTTVFPGAIYLHQGKAFEIETYDDDIALAHPAPNADIRTFARTQTTVDILSTQHKVDLPDGQWCYGTVNVRTQMIGYDVRRISDGVHLGRTNLDMPVRDFITAGTWLTLTDSTIRKSGIDTTELPGALHAGEHAMIALLPLLATCDRWDLGGLSTAVHPDTGQPTIIIHDAISGGSGAAYRGFYAGPQWIAATLETLLTCTCESGCPACIQSPKCGNNNNPLSKTGATLLMATIADQFYNADQLWPLPAYQNLPIPFSDDQLQ
ncbi:DEAD/DEAH box helicase [Arcanobacterium buesumense]|uniref:DEAD/DEAH box helicase n=1 Tax=Arcanobacterium buesumense TaxID=2722751 RepID=A0A6H2EN72_9ACTO|nr:DEAD/DEAH box helicase [Arcanobacterium buesumense]QJC22528.1 DEAD/DEAH box helicase [Arcanobacterium buesumense]